MPHDDMTGCDVTRMRITLTPVPDDCTDADTVDEDDLRELASAGTSGNAINWTQFAQRAMRTAVAIAAALPKPRIHPQPGDVLRRKSDGWCWVYPDITRADDGLDPVAWDHVTAAELAEMFDRKRAQS